MEGALLSREALHDDLGVLVNPHLGRRGHLPSGSLPHGSLCYSDSKHHDVVLYVTHRGHRTSTAYSLMSVAKLLLCAKRKWRCAASLASRKKNCYSVFSKYRRHVFGGEETKNLPRGKTKIKNPMCVTLSWSCHEMPRPVLLVLGICWIGANRWMLVGATDAKIPMGSREKASCLELTNLK